MMKFSEITVEQLEQLSQQHPDGNFVQSKGMAITQKQLGKIPLCYGVFDDDKLIGGALVNIRQGKLKMKFAHINQGPLLDFNNPELTRFFFKELVRVLKEKQVVSCVVTPNFTYQQRDIEAQPVEHGIRHDDYHQLLLNCGLKFHGFDDSLINGVGRWFFEKDLTEFDSEAALISSYSTNTKRKITAAKNLPIEIVSLKFDQMADFQEVMKHTTSLKGFAYRDNMYGLMKEHFGEDCQIWLAQLDNRQYSQQLNNQKEQLTLQVATLQESVAHNEKKSEVNKLKETSRLLESVLSKLHQIEKYQDQEQVVLGGAMFVKYNQEITYVHGGSYHDLVSLNAIDLLLHNALLWGIENHSKTFDFYGTRGAYCGDKEEGVYRFKKGFRGVVVEQPGNYELPVNPFKYRLLSLINKIRK